MIKSFIKKLVHKLKYRFNRQYRAYYEEAEYEYMVSREQ